MRGGKSPERADIGRGQEILGRRHLLRRIRAEIVTVGLPPEREEIALKLAEDIVFAWGNGNGWEQDV